MFKSLVHGLLDNYLRLHNYAEEKSAGLILETMPHIIPLTWRVTIGAYHNHIQEKRIHHALYEAFQFLTTAPVQTPGELRFGKLPDSYLM